MKDINIVCLVNGHIVDTGAGDGYFTPRCVFCAEWLPLNPYKWFEVGGLMWDLMERMKKGLTPDQADEVDEYLYELIDADPYSYIHHRDFVLNPIVHNKYVRDLYFESCHANQWVRMTGEAGFHGAMVKPGTKRRVLPFHMKTVMYLLKKGWVQEQDASADGVWGIHSIRTNIGGS